MAARKHAMMFAAILLGVAIAATACSTGTTTTSTSNASQTSVDQLAARTQRNEMLFAVVNVSALPLHEMSVSLNGGKVDPTFVPMTRTTIRLLALTNWDTTLKGDADKVRGHAVDLLKALEDGNLDAAKDPADKLHDGYHDFSGKVWEVVAKDLPPDAGGVAPHSDEATPAPTSVSPGNSSPIAGVTP